MRVDFRTPVIEARIYDKGSYEEDSPYCGGFVIYVDDDTATVRLLTGPWNADIDRQVYGYLKKLGVKRVHYRHKGERVERDLEKPYRYVESDRGSTHTGEGLE